MENYDLEEFEDDIRRNREFEFIYKGKMYAMTYTAEGFTFTDCRESVYAIFKTYGDLLESIRIDDYTIQDIILGEKYEDLTIF